jgi:hypothetical protein
MSSEKSYDDHFNDGIFNSTHRNSNNLVRPKMWAASTSKMQHRTKNNEFTTAGQQNLERDHLQHVRSNNGSKKLFMWSDKA